MLAPWRSPLARALHRNRSLAHARYLQLATLRQDGHPANRTVVFRGFLDSTNQLKFVTDARSEKFAQVEYSPWAEACWYFAQTREQFRLMGQLTLVSDRDDDPLLQQARLTSWQELSDAARTQFAWAYPGKPREGDAGFDVPIPDAKVPLSHFCLLLLDPEQVDHLELRGNPQNRWIHDRQGQEWTTQEVNP